MFADAGQIQAVPSERVGRAVGAEKHAFAKEGLHQLAKLGAIELQQGNRLGRHTEALQDGESRDQGRGRRNAEVKLQPDGDGIARGGGGEVGRQEQAEHGKRVWHRTGNEELKNCGLGRRIWPVQVGAKGGA